LVGPTSVTAQEAGSPDTVTVEARREVDVEPDIGQVTLGVRSTGSTAEEATDELTERARAVIAALEGAGFTDDEIDTVNVSLDRRCVRFCRNRDDDSPPRVIGYVGSTGVRVETNQIDRLGEVIDVGIEAGATGVRGVSFDVEDKSAAVKEALRQAMLLARDKATTLAETGGRTLGRALVILEGNSQLPRRFDVPHSKVVAFRSGDASSGGTAGGSNPFPIEPPTLSATARIEVTFELI
jgi:uncharacterized protein YggE